MAEFNIYYFNREDAKTPSRKEFKLAPFRLCDLAFKI